MPSKLVIVESPAKAKTINKILGNAYSVKASMGHVRDLPQKRIGVDVENNFEPYYQVIPSRQKHVNELKRVAAKASEVYMATDMDREGEAIAWHLVAALEVEDKTVHRVMFNEITKRAITAAFEQPMALNMDKINAQQARRILDRLVGYQISPLLWKKGLRGKSAGRVQSVAVRLIVEREREIQAFVTEEYWRITAQLLGGKTDTEPGQEFMAELLKIDGEDIKIGEEAIAKQVVEELESAQYVVVKVDKKEKKGKPAPPFHTSSLQQRASTVMRFSASRTMRIAQQLYEGVDVGDEGTVGLITYMRTDSFRVADEAIDACREVIAQKYGDKYLPAKPNVYKSRKQAQGAHEAIRPTDVTRTPEDMKSHLNNDQLRLYKLIWERFVASQMKPAVYNVTEAEIQAGRGLFTARGRELLFPGHLVVMGKAEQDEKDQLLPELSVDQIVELLKLDPTQHFTKPPPRYSEASLVRTLERNGVGRPSTYAPILSRIQQVGYVELKERQFHATEIGMIVTDLLVQHFADILNIEFTSHMEEELDRIEEEHKDWHEVLREFYEPFAKDLEAATHEMVHVTDMLPKVDIKCEKCGEPMVMRISRQGRFLGCSGYPDCKNIKPVDENGNILEPKVADEPCEKCGSVMVVKTGRHGPFLACSGYPECKNTKPLTKEGEPLPKTDEKCEACGAPMVVRTSRRGPFLGCSAYPECRNTKPLDGGEPETTDEKCEKCGKPMVVKAGRRGKFLACSGYPECKNTKQAPKGTSASQKTDLFCDKCGKPMAIKSGRRGKFIACTGYPKCKNAQPLPTGTACPKCESEIVEHENEDGAITFRCSKHPECDHKTVLGAAPDAKAEPKTEAEAEPEADDTPDEE